MDSAKVDAQGSTWLGKPGAAGGRDNGRGAAPWCGSGRVQLASPVYGRIDLPGRMRTVVLIPRDEVSLIVRPALAACVRNWALIFGAWWCVSVVGGGGVRFSDARRAWRPVADRAD